MTGASDVGPAHAAQRSRPSNQLRLHAIRRTDAEVVPVSVNVSRHLNVDESVWRTLEFDDAVSFRRECAPNVTRPGASRRKPPTPWLASPPFATAA